MKVKNKVAFITGGGSGIGREACIKLFQLESIVIIADKNEQGGKETLKLLEKIRSSDFNSRATFMICDVTDENSVKSAMEQTIKQFGSLDIVFNNAGIMEAPYTFIHPTDRRWKKTIDVNFYGVVNGTQIAIQLMKDHKIQGVIINTASMGGLWLMPQTPVYGATKAGIIHFSKCVSKALQEEGTPIRVNAICPEITETPLMLQTADVEAVKAVYGGILTVDQIAKGFVELVTDETKNGAVLAITIKKGSFYWGNRSKL